MLDRCDHCNEEQLQARPVVSNKRRRYKRRGSRCHSMLAASIAASSHRDGVDCDTLSATTGRALRRSHSSRGLRQATRESESGTTSSLFGCSHATTSTERVFDALILPVDLPRRSPSQLLSEALSVLEAHHHRSNVNSDGDIGNININNSAAKAHVTKRCPPPSYSGSASIPGSLMRLLDENNVLRPNHAASNSDPALDIVRQALGLTKRGLVDKE
eukprot:jgi/Psemu1/69356/estExt_Genemark1.C_8200010